jgi:hypothetical protein
MKIQKLSDARKQLTKSRTELLEAFRLGGFARLFLFVVSCVIGLLLYSGLVCVLYGRLYDACLRSDVITESLNQIPSSHVYKTSELDDARIYSLLQYFQLLSEEETNPDSLTHDTSPNYLVYDSLRKSELYPTAGLIWRIEREAQPIKCACKETNLSLCEEYYTAQIAAAVAQLPSPKGVSGESLADQLPEKIADREELDGLDGFFTSDSGREVSKTRIGILLQPLIRSTMGQRFFYSKMGHGMTSGNYWLRLERPSPEMTPEQLSNGLAVKWSSCSSDGPSTSSATTFPTKEAAWVAAVQRQNLQRFVAILLMKLRGSPDVRSARIWVNGLIGRERLAIIILAIFFILLFLRRSRVRRRHDRARRYVETELLALDGITPWTPLKERCAAANDILTNAARHQGTIPLSILMAAHSQMAARVSDSTLSAKDDYVGMRAAQERQELDSTRWLFDILLPTFPAIGFIGTVSSLLIAMSQADRIVSTTDAFAKGLAASQVTDILSLCFSTTFMALCAVLIFSPLSLWQQAQEHRLVDDIHRLIELVLRPGQ